MSTEQLHSNNCCVQPSNMRVLPVRSVVKAEFGVALLLHELFRLTDAVPKFRGTDVCHVQIEQSGAVKLKGLL